LATKDGEGFVQIAVADNGSGVAQDIEAALFDPFVTTKATGMGLGLAISRSIVEAHGGRLWHERASPGSVFAFTLPIAGGEGNANEHLLGDQQPEEVER
jgi:two-component system sensor kinase FixL